MVLKGTFGSDTLQIDSHSFEVECVSSITIKLVSGAFEHVFCVVRDADGVLRALMTYKSRIREATITELPFSTSNTALAGPLPAGTWTIDVVRTYPVAGDYEISVEFDRAIDYTSCDARDFNPLATDFEHVVDERDGWYSGDLHAHSAWSDGRVTLTEVAYATERAHLDFLGMSDHSIATTKFPHAEFLVLPSTEVTWDDNGHYNIHGLTELPAWDRYVAAAGGVDMAAKSRALDAVFADAHAKGCVVTINHPFPYGWELLHDFDLANVDVIEVINAPHLMDPEVDNERAVRLFDYLWSRGVRLMAVGGSDAHKKSYFERYPVGLPTTHVRMSGLSVAHVLDAVRAGHSFVSVWEDFEVAFRRPGDSKETVLPGDRLQGTVLFEARSSAPVTWELVRSGEVIARSEGCRCEIEADVEPESWLRLQARAATGELVFFANPVHDCALPAEVRSFQELLKGFYAHEQRTRS